MKIKTVLFDLDGTLLDTAPGLRMSVNAALAQCGYPPRTLEQIAAAMGNGMVDLIARSLPGGAADEKFDECFAAFRADYKTAMFRGSAPYEGIPELLRALRAEGCAVAVVSNKRDDAVKALCARFFGPLVDVVIGEQPGVSRKPAPDSVFAALKELGAAAESAAYVGDSEVDVATAKNAGLPCFAVDWGTRPRAVLAAAGAASISSSPEELLRALRAN